MFTFFLFTIHIHVNRRKYWLYSQHCLYFPFSVYYRLKEKRETFFCCLNTLLITIYKFKLVQNKKTIFLLLQKKLTLGSLTQYWQQPLGKQVPDHGNQVLTCGGLGPLRTSVLQRSPWCFDKHQTAVVTR